MKTFHPEPLDLLLLFIIEERRNKAKHLTWNSITLKFLKNTNMPNPVKSLGYIKCYSSINPRPVKSPSNSFRYNCKKTCSWLRRPKTTLEIRKRPHFSMWSTTPLFTGFSKTNRVKVFSSRPFHNILKYRDHQWNIPTIWKTGSW